MEKDCKRLYVKDYKRLKKNKKEKKFKGLQKIEKESWLSWKLIDEDNFEEAGNWIKQKNIQGILKKAALAHAQP